MRCEGCHAGGPRLVFDPKTGRMRDIAMDPRALAGSAHAKLACRECHIGRFDLFPHPPNRRDTYRCLDCHPRQGEPEAALYASIRDEVAASAHGRLRGFGCERCHDPHRFRGLRATDPATQIRALHNGPCLSCHAATASGPLADPARPDLEAVHHRLLHPELHLAVNRCIDCHDAQAAVPLAFSHALPPAAATPFLCTTCHGRPSLLESRFLRLRPEPQTAAVIAGARLLEIGQPTGAVRLWPLDAAVGLACLLLLTLFGWHAVKAPGFTNPERATLADRHPALRLWHAGTALLGILLLASGLGLHFGLDGPGPLAFAQQERLHRLLGLLLAGLWLVAFGAFAACRRDRLWFAPAYGPGLWPEFRAYLWALLRGAPLPAARPVAGRFGRLQARSYGLVVLLLLPGLILTGLGLLAPERLQGTFAHLPGRSGLAWLHHALAMGFGLFVCLHVLLVLASRRGTGHRSAPPAAKPGSAGHLANGGL